jgi:hypothetical protein
VKTVNVSHSHKTAASALLARKGDLTYRALAAALSAETGRAVNRGFLCDIAHGRRDAPNWLRVALGLPLRAVHVAPLACGHAPLARRCPICTPRKHVSTRRRVRGIW